MSDEDIHDVIILGGGPAKYLPSFSKIKDCGA